MKRAGIGFAFQQKTLSTGGQEPSDSCSVIEYLDALLCAKSRLKLRRNQGRNGRQRHAVSATLESAAIPRAASCLDKNRTRRGAMFTSPRSQMEAYGSLGFMLSVLAWKSYFENRAML
jgi:hypothetical protein